MKSITADVLYLEYQYGRAGYPDRTGNVTGIADSRTDHSQRFTYDALDRLASSTGTSASTVIPVEAHDYHSNGNRRGPGYDYEPGATLRLWRHTTGGVTREFSYDNNGNTKTAGSGSA